MRAHALTLVALVALAGLAGAITDKGVIYLDDMTFDKVVDRSRDVLVRFDREYPWGDEHDAFKELATTVGGSDTPLLVVGVPISNSETYPVNTKLSARYGLTGVKDDAWPVYRLFKKGADTAKPLPYDGDMKRASELLRWVVEATGVFVGVKGQVAALDAAAREFMAAPPGERKALLAAAAAAADGVDAGASPDAAGYVEYYMRVMARVIDKGDAWVEQVGGAAPRRAGRGARWRRAQRRRARPTAAAAAVGGPAAQESKRLRKMADDKAVAAGKRETFQWRLNILASFGGSGAAPDKGSKEEL
ncbi:Erp29 [Scenedesmus sp. PABB004]|nr:Erp29 [Scenedesmus sp. PABB004]